MVRLVMVIVLLAIPATELLKPGACLEDLQGMVPVLTMMEQSDVGQNDGVVTVAQPPPSDHSNRPSDDECFCCCAHVMPQLIFVPSDHEIYVKVIPDVLQDLVLPMGDPPYHPPQVA